MVDTKDAVRLVDASPEQLRTALQNSINENQDLREQIAVLKRMLFGRRRESSDNLPDGQTNLFNEHIITGEEQSIIDKPPVMTARSPRRSSRKRHGPRAPT